MKTSVLVDALTYAEFIASIAALVFIARRKQIRTFGFVVGFLLTRVLSLAILLPLIYMPKTHGFIERHLAYKVYFYTYWSSYAIEALLGFGIIYSLFKLAMDPLPGLQRLGMVMFRWAGGIALALAVSAGCGPHITSTSFMIKFVTELQQTQSVITLCMLLFVTLASKPMGLSHRSKIVGISLGLGVLAATDLIGSAWMSHFGSMASSYNVVNGIAVCATLSIWMTYFALPEPKRRMIVLPTTSPFLRWNQISQVLGDDPGFVAIGRITPEMFAPAEVEIMLRASVKMSPLPATKKKIPQSINSRSLTAVG